jgi:hypothetical protein
VKHTHRIVPGHMGGQYTSGNTVEVDISSCDKITATHPMWHFANWQLWGKEEDRIAWKGLSGLSNAAETSMEAYLAGARKGGKASKEKRVGIFDPVIREGYKKLGIAARMSKDPETQRKAALKRAETWRGGKHTEESIEKMRALKPKGEYSNKGYTQASRQVITMTNLDGRVETHPHWRWREMGVRYDRAGISREHSKGWQYPHCPLDQAMPE